MIKAIFIILGVLLALILLLLLLLIFGKASIRLIFRGDLTVVLSVLGIRFKLFPSDQKPKSERAKRREALKKQKRKQKKALQKAQNAGKPQPNLLENLEMIFSIVKLAHRKLRGKMIIQINRFSVRVATGDAAKTAILYGAVTGVCVAFWQWVDTEISPVRRKAGAMEVIPDYLAAQPSADLDLLLGMKLLPGLVIAVSLFSAFKQGRAYAFRQAARRVAEKAQRNTAATSTQADK